ncbi:fasciclin domain-containing protein [Planktosalinus lacus]|uniref:fasciclin domain-containing protein n=1 Tax=Planktosalinus lacus TaxID=1526573 RepID=UPI0016669F0F|nr:fasciclin domain-containing protein [Planktosalinus lacus]
MKPHRLLFQQIFLFCLLFTFSVSGQNKYSTSAQTTTTKQLEGDTIYSNLSIQVNLSKIENFSIYSRILELVDFETLTKEKEMVTLFVVPNEAFSHMTEEEIEVFLALGNRDYLKNTLSYYIIPGRVDEHAIAKAIERGKGSANFKALGGKNLRFKIEGDTIYLLTGTGSKTRLLQTNFQHSRGFFHLTTDLALSKTQN